VDRKDFIKKTTAAGFGGTLLLATPTLLVGKPNESINFAVVGVRSRGKAHAEAIKELENAHITWMCDVDDVIIDEHRKWHQDTLGYVPGLERDFRKLVEKPDIDVITIATPEHWHTPMAIMAMEAGKHVYIEKPCSHNPHENELVVAAQAKYGKLCQMGNQQRSAVTSNLAIKEIREGIIGTPYYGKAWYSNTRGSIGTGQKVSVPKNLDWELWQGPAPRRHYRDNVHPYNWHWFRDWGTGEIHNNGTHEIDICRWALGVDLPNKVTSSGGRFHFEDDWEFYDTQVASFEFEGGKLISWEGKSCNGQRFYGRGRGSLIHGTEGTVLLDRDGYWLYDLSGNLIKEEKEPVYGASDTGDTRGFDGLTITHFNNLANAIRFGENLNAPIADAAISTMLCHYGNIAQEVGGSIQVDPNSGKIVNSEAAQKFWKREYEPGWEPKV
jgi:predicted dehydrogenase